MSDNLSFAVASGRTALGGLPQRLVQDGLIDDTAAHAALHDSREKKTSFVTQLVANGSARARDIAVAASVEFGVPIFDLDSLNPDVDVTRLVSDKLLLKHHVLPLFKRGNRLFVGVSDPTNTRALDEIKFQTNLTVEAVVVDEDKLQKAVDQAIETADSHSPRLGEDDDVTSRTSRSAATTTPTPDRSAATTSTTRRS